MPSRSSRLPPGTVSFRPFFFGCKHPASGKRGEEGPPSPACSLKLYKTVSRNLCRLTKWFDANPSYKTLVSTVWRLPNEKNNSLYDRLLKRYLSRGRRYYLPFPDACAADLSLTRSVIAWVRRRTLQENVRRGLLDMPRQPMRAADLSVEQPAAAKAGAEKKASFSANNVEEKLEELLNRQAVVGETVRVLKVTDVQRKSQGLIDGSRGGEGSCIEAAFCAMRHLSRLRRYSSVRAGDGWTGIAPPPDAVAQNKNEHVSLDDAYAWTDDAERHKWKSALEVVTTNRSFPAAQLERGLLLIAHPLSTGIWSRSVILLTAVPSPEDCSPRAIEKPDLLFGRSSLQIINRTLARLKQRSHQETDNDYLTTSTPTASSSPSLTAEGYVTGICLNKRLPDIEEGGQERRVDGGGEASIRAALKDCGEVDMDFLRSLHDQLVGLLRRYNTIGCARAVVAESPNKPDSCEESPSESFATSSTRAASTTTNNGDSPEGEEALQPRPLQDEADGMAAGYGGRAVWSEITPDVGELTADVEELKNGRRRARGRRRDNREFGYLRTTKFSGSHRMMRLGMTVVTSQDGSPVLEANNTKATTDGLVYTLGDRAEAGGGTLGETVEDVRDLLDEFSPYDDDSSLLTQPAELVGLKCFFRYVRACLSGLEDRLRLVPPTTTAPTLGEGQDDAPLPSECSSLPSSNSQHLPSTTTSTTTTTTTTAQQQQLPSPAVGSAAPHLLSYRCGGPVPAFGIFHSEKKLGRRVVVDGCLYGGLRKTRGSGGSNSKPQQQQQVGGGGDGGVMRVVGLSGWSADQLVWEIKRGLWLPLRVSDKQVLREMVWGGAATDETTTEDSTTEETTTGETTTKRGCSFVLDGDFAEQQPRRLGRPNEVLWRKLLSALGGVYEEMSRMPLEGVEKYLGDGLAQRVRVDNGREPPRRQTPPTTKKPPTDSWSSGGPSSPPSSTTGPAGVQPPSSSPPPPPRSAALEEDIPRPQPREAEAFVRSTSKGARKGRTSGTLYTWLLGEDSSEEDEWGGGGEGMSSDSDEDDDDDQSTMPPPGGRATTEEADGQLGQLKRDDRESK
eukprot:GHVS01029614.1.p1 GENE.GHVS01029614.1~~GHVS01029614.1.p1  ORF type:complete len:1070 (-),score=247.46 GHVS01029614.1:138-3347(-)